MLALGLCLACSAGSGSKANSSTGGNGAADPGSGGTVSLAGTTVTGLGGINTAGDTSGGDDDNPTSCAQAAAKRTYIGCDFWPTVTYNPVYSEFDFAVVVANSGATDAQITVTGPASFMTTDTVPPAASRP